MDFLRLFLLLGSSGCLVIWSWLRRPPEEMDQEWRDAVTRELVAGRSLGSAIIDQRGEGARASIHAACRGLEVRPAQDGTSSSLLLEATAMARRVSMKKTEEAAAAVKEALDSFDEDEMRLAEMASSAAFRGLVLSLVLCFVVPFFVDLLPLLGVLQSGSFAPAPVDPVLKELGVALALVSSYHLSNVASTGGRGREWGTMAAFMGVLFVSTSLASSLPLLSGP